MEPIDRWLRQNEAWANTQTDNQADIFTQHAGGQRPKALWIGCVDSRVPPEAITGAALGELFVHRNVANQVLHEDLNLTAAMEFSIRALGVEHIVVCAHTGCGGVDAALKGTRVGQMDPWIDRIGDGLGLDAATPLDQACEHNAMAQQQRLSEHPVVKAAWADNLALTLHALIYHLEDGRLRRVGAPVSSA